MEKIVSLVTLGFGVTQDSTGAESETDRLSSRYAVGVLALLAVYLSISGSPLNCYIDGSVSRYNKGYMDAQCWSQNTYVTVAGSPDKVYLTFYPWLSLLLVCQAVMFCLPSTVWYTMCKFAGVSTTSVIESAVQFYKSKTSSDAEQIFYNFTGSLYRFLEKRRQHFHKSTTQKLRNPRLDNSHYLPACYILIQVLLTGNCILQLWILNNFLFLDPKQVSFIVHVFQVIISSFGWYGRENLKYFPTISYCDLEIRAGSVPGYNTTVQCTLDKDWFYESMFIVLALLYVVLFIAHGLSLLWWVWALYIKYSSISTYAWIGKHLRDTNCNFSHTYVSSLLKESVAEDWISIKHVIQEHLDPGDAHKECSEDERQAFAKNLTGFVQKFLRHDGIFAYRMIVANTSERVGNLMLHHLWARYRLSKNKHVLEADEQTSDNFRKHDVVRRVQEKEDEQQSFDSRSPEDIELEDMSMLDIDFFTKQLRLAKTKDSGTKRTYEVKLNNVHKLLK